MISQIQRMNGPINTVNDTFIGGQPNFNGTGSKVAGQLGAVIELSDDNVFADTTVGVVYGGLFQYVHLAAAAGAMVRGQIAFWNPAADLDDFEVTTLESGTTPGAMMRAGIFLSDALDADNYGYIQIAGLVAIKFIAALTNVPSGVGCGVYCAAQGAGADNGLADVYASANPADYSDVTIFQARWLGTAQELPTNGGTKIVNLSLANARG